MHSFRYFANLSVDSYQIKIHSKPILRDMFIFDHNNNNSLVYIATKKNIYKMEVQRDKIKKFEWSFVETRTS